MPRRRRRAGFGLIEVIVGLAVVAVLAAVTPLVERRPDSESGARSELSDPRPTPAACEAASEGAREHPSRRFPAGEFCPLRPPDSSYRY